MEKVLNMNNNENTKQESNEDFCLWESSKILEEKGIFIQRGFYKPSCKEDYEDDDFRDWLDIRHYNFCPYCSKKLKVVEYN